ncbi:hypothetical protein RHOFW510R12_01155 [Rhodanobacter sp. FW510-R12]|uniref:hypothetical protein n=1 Tax=Rhodanobacter thiooxydans TaxID=416169 RepID=UPI0009128FBB|nr:hypothetical protein [Rhodanobacter thiooxydans]UJJ56653.1 hypothetical protein LRK53_18770 [Rhodanobacter thiooxydans]
MRKELTLALAIVLAGCGKAADHQDSAAVPVAAAPAPVRAIPDIRGLKLGDSQAQVSARFPTAACEAKGGQVLCQVNGTGYGGSESGILQIILESDHAVAIGAKALEGDKFNLIVSAMITKFGSPDDAAHRPAMASSADVTWTGDHWWLVAAPHDEGSSFAGVTLINSDWVDARLKSKLSGAAKNL